MKEKTGDSMPTRQDSPWFPQPPPSWKVKKTSDAGLGMSARIHSGMRIAKKPRIWSTRTTPSRRGSLETKNVLNMSEKVNTDQVSRTPCHGCGV